MSREKIMLLISGNVFNLAGAFTHNLPLQIAGLSILIYCVIISYCDYLKTKKREKELQAEIDKIRKMLNLNENLEDNNDET